MAKAKAEKLVTTYIDLATIGTLPMNFKTHDIAETEKSIRLRGVIDPIGVNPETMNSFDGNGRVETLTAMHAKWLNPAKKEDKEPPKYVVVEDMKWFVPVIYVSMTADQEKSAAAALNRINQLGGYDEAVMLEVLEELKGKDMLDGTGYTDKDLTALLKRFPGQGGQDGETANKAAQEAVKGTAPGIKTTAAVSSVKQVGLLFNPEDHVRFTERVVQLSKLLNTTNTTDTVLKAMEYAHDNLNTKAGTE